MDHNSPPATPEWQPGKLPDDDIENLHADLSNLGTLPIAFQDLGNGLGAGSARTVYVLPRVTTSHNSVAAMVSAAREASAVIYEEGLEGISPDSTPSLVLQHETPGQFNVPSMPEGVRASIPAEFPIEESPIAYMRAENRGMGAKHSVGVFDPQTQTHFSVPLN